jgi:hypothetical protein
MKAAKKNAIAKKMKEIKCPCADYKNQKIWDKPSIIETHLVSRGFVDGYTNWSHHGEIPSCHRRVPNQETHDKVLRGKNFVVVEESVDDELDDDVGDDGHDTVDDVDDGHVMVDDADGSDGTSFDWEEMLRHPEPEVVAGFACGLDNFNALQKASKELFYDEAKGCGKDFTLLRTVLELLRLKARNNWFDSSFNDLLVLLKELLPKPNSMPTSTYEAKKLICPLSLGVQKIHACVKPLYPIP